MLSESSLACSFRLPGARRNMRCPTPRGRVPVQSQRSIFVQGSDLCEHERCRVKSCCDLGMRVLNGSHFVLRLVCCATTGEPLQRAGSLMAMRAIVYSAAVRPADETAFSAPLRHYNSGFDLCASADSRRRCTLDKTGYRPLPNRSHAPGHLLIAEKQCKRSIGRNFGPSALIADRRCPPDCPAREKSQQSGSKQSTIEPQIEYTKPVCIVQMMPFISIIYRSSALIRLLPIVIPLRQ
jgi:hypothetical protein